jgi:hypothetical protein
MAHRYVDTYARLARTVGTMPADIVVVDDTAAPFAQDLVLNRPDLSNRPIRLLASRIDPGTLRALCQVHTVALIGGATLNPIAVLHGQPTPVLASAAMARLKRAVATGCSQHARSFVSR